MSDQVRISHALNLLSNLENMKEKEIVCDFTIKIGNESFSVHRAVLVASSNYFGGMFSSNMKEVQEGRVEMKNLGVKGIQQSVEFMYTGSARITSESVQDILLAADLFQLEGLKGLCFQSLLDNLSPQNCLSVINLAEAYNRRDLKVKAERAVVTNFEAVISSEMFPSISRSELLRYISNVSYQTSWKAAITWAKDKEEFPQLIERMDIKKLPIKFLLQTVLEEPLVKKSENMKNLVVSALFSDAKKLEKNLDAVNCMRFNILAKTQNVDKAIHDVISRFMKKHFEEVVTKVEFCDVDKNDVLGLFRSGETKYSSETVKWEAALEWVKHDIPNRQKVFAELFSLIKLKDLGWEFLKGTVRKENLVKDSRKCTDALMDAFISKAEQSKKPGVQDLTGAQATEETYSDSDQKSSSGSGESTENEKGAVGGIRQIAKCNSLSQWVSAPTVIINQQPRNGYMQQKSAAWKGSIEILYSFPAGQLEGVSYPSQKFLAHLPRHVSPSLVIRLRNAFNGGHVFKVESRDGQQNGRIIWGHIPHKTSVTGGPVNTGFMDGDYLDRLDAALKSKGF